MERRFQNLESRRIFVARLANGTKKQHLFRVFQPAGAIHAVVRRKLTGNVAFVTFSTIAQARDAVEASTRNPIKLHGRRLAVGMADAWNARDTIPKVPCIGNPKPDPLDGNFRPLVVPAEVVAVIASYMNYRDLAKMEQVSKSWRTGVICYLERTSKLSLEDRRWPRDWTSSNITKDCFVWLAKRCGTNLKEAVLADEGATEDLRPQCLTILASYNPGLEILDLTGFRALPSGLRTIGENLKQLITLKLGRVDGPVDPELTWLFRNTKIRNFSATATALTGTALTDLNPDIEELTLIDIPARPAALAEAILRCRKLQGLHLKRPKDFNESVLVSIASNEAVGSTLTKITLEWCNPRPSREEEEMEIPEEEVQVADFFELPDDDIEAASSVPSRLLLTTTAEFLFNGWIDNNFVSEMGLHMTQLRELNITGNSNIRGQFSLEPLGQLYDLRHLVMNLLHPSVGAQFLKEYRQLQRLECRDNGGVTDEDVCGLIRSCPTIQDIDVEGCKQVGRPVVDCVQQVLRGNPRGINFNLRVGGTGARSYRKDRKMMHVRIIYERQSPDPYAN